MAYKPIGDYGIIGDMHTAALVSLDGSIDWLCLPDFDSPSVFASILDENRGGSFSITSESPESQSRQFYFPETNVLITRFTDAECVARIADFMLVPRASARMSMRPTAGALSGMSQESRAPAGFAWSAVPRSITRVRNTRSKK
jgi:GH15 family glucan-1,4-alpha-glucosidase